MIPAGYMAKHIAARPDWITAQRVADIYSVSQCISGNFADYIQYWRHNGYWLFDSPEIIRALAKAHSLSLAGCGLFYYEIHELEYAEEQGRWMPFAPEPTFTTAVVRPDEKQLEGYDVVTFHAHTSPECSPLSCNSLATEIGTNEHCLLETSEQASALLEAGRFNHAEPGPYRIFAVYSVQWP